MASQKTKDEIALQDTEKEQAGVAVKKSECTAEEVEQGYTKTPQELRAELLANLRAARPKSVPVHLFKDTGKYKSDVFVSVNGRRYQLKRGVSLTVPWEIDAALKNSQQQDAAAARLMEKYASEARFANA